jgi:hypothetical protein
LLYGCSIKNPEQYSVSDGQEQRILAFSVSDEDNNTNNVKNEEAGGDMSAVALQVDEKVLFDFSNVNKAGRWVIVNDGVMGGLSQSEITLSSQGTAIFQGTLSLENYGGFASIRTVPYRLGLQSYDGISLRVRGDGRRYKLRLRTDQYMDGPAYEAEFDTVADTWVTVNIPFQDTVPTFRGRRLMDLPQLDGNKIVQIGVMLADKNSGPFRLEMSWIRAYRTLM